MMGPRRGERLRRGGALRRAILWVSRSSCSCCFFKISFVSLISVCVRAVSVRELLCIAYYNPNANDTELLRPHILVGSHSSSKLIASPLTSSKVALGFRRTYCLKLCRKEPSHTYLINWLRNNTSAFGMPPGACDFTFPKRPNKARENSCNVSPVVSWR